MDIELIKAFVNSTGAVVVVVIFMWYLIQREKRTAETIQRIHCEDHDQLATAINANSAQTNKLARAVLVSTLTTQGMGVDEAERRAREIVANGDLAKT